MKTSTCQTNCLFLFIFRIFEGDMGRINGDMGRINGDMGRINECTRLGMLYNNKTKSNLQL